MQGATRSILRRRDGFLAEIGRAPLRGGHVCPRAAPPGFEARPALG